MCSLSADQSLNHPDLARSGRTDTRVLYSMLAFSAFACGCSGEGGNSSLREAIVGVPVAGELDWDERLTDTSLVVIVSDTMRRDRIGAYGGPARTPVIDSFGRENLLFEEAYSQAPWTKPSIATVFTSMYPSQHGVLHHPRLVQRGSERTREREIMELDVLAEDNTTLAEALRSAGLRTAGFVGNPWMARSFGFAQGFELYDDSFAGWDVSGEEVSTAGLEWLEGLADGSRFFLYLHYMDCHQPFIPVDTDALASRVDELNGDQRLVTVSAAADIAGIVKRVDGQSATRSGLRPTIALAEYAYDQGVERFDRALGVFLSGFKDHPAYERTAIIVTSDHGEALFDRGYGNHANGLYDDEVAVPLMARLPGVSSKSHRLEQLVGLIDLFPTVCEYLQVDIPASVNGNSWLSIEPSGVRSPPTCLVTEGVSAKPFNRAVRTRNYKLLWQPQGGPDGKEHALFNIRDDPEETVDLLSKEHSNVEAQGIARELVHLSREMVPKYERSETLFVPVGEDVLERLRSLGYLDNDDEASDPEEGAAIDREE